MLWNGNLSVTSRCISRSSQPYRGLFCPGSLSPVDKTTKREEIKQLIYDLSKTYPDLKERVFGAMQRLPLPEWGPKGRYNRPKYED